MSFYALIPAAGTGSRMGGNMSKSSTCRSMPYP